MSMKRRTEDGICEVDFVNSDEVEAARAAVAEEAVLRETAQAVKALAHPGRMKVLMALNGRELCVCDLSQVLGLSMSGTSQQLKELRRIGAIDFRTEGKLVYYTLVDPFWLAIVDTVIEKLGLAAAPSSGGKPKR